MARQKINYFRLPNRFIVTLFVLLALLIVGIEFDVIQYAYEKIGVVRRYVFALLMSSLLGSYVNRWDLFARYYRGVADVTTLTSPTFMVAAQTLPDFF